MSKGKASVSRADMRKGKASVSRAGLRKGKASGSASTFISIMIIF